MCMRGADSAPKFEINDVSFTPGALRLPENDILLALMRHSEGDWGDLDPESRLASDEALARGGELVSAFYSAYGVRFLVVTDEDRSVTTLMLESER